MDEAADRDTRIANGESRMVDGKNRESRIANGEWRMENGQDRESRIANGESGVVGRKLGVRGCGFKTRLRVLRGSLAWDRVSHTPGCVRPQSTKAHFFIDHNFSPL
jgi:hypothetical protein